MKIILESNSFFLFNEEIIKLQKKYQINSDNLFFYSQKEDLGAVVNQYLTSSLFETKKLIIFKNTNSLLLDNFTKSFIFFLETIFKYKSDNLIVFHFEKLPKNNLFQKKFIDSTTQVIKILKPEKKDLLIFLRKYLNDKNIPFQTKALKKIIIMCKYNFEFILHELEKFNLLEREINEENISLVVNDFQGEKIFSFLNYFFNKNYQELIKLIDDFESKNSNFIPLIEYLLNEIQLIIHFSIIDKLQKQGIDFNNQQDLNLSQFRSHYLKSWTNQLSHSLLKDLYLEIIKIKKELFTNTPPYISQIIKSKLIFLSKNF